MTMPIDVLVFLKACDQNPSVENVTLYRNLIVEEFWEFMDADKKNDEVERLDACMDMIWVILGYCHMKGWDIRGAWEEVSKNNLSKIDQETGKVKRRDDGKILKPEGWQEPDFSKYI